MLEKPPLKDESIVACLERDFRLSVANISFLPLGADLNTAVYRVTANDGTLYLLKLRHGDLNRASVTIPRFLSEQGIEQIIPSLATKIGQLWADLDPFKAILYPYVEGRNGYEAGMSEQQWIEFGGALQRFHSAALPPQLTTGIERETFSPQWRQAVRSHLSRLEEETYTEPVATETAAFLKANSEPTLALVRRAEQLARSLQAHPPDFILCHGDIHLWNLLIDVAGDLYIVDWDTLIFAPKERDLMFIGAGLGDSSYTPAEEEAHFYQGYGPTEVNPSAIAYYRCERIVEDIAIFCEQIFMSSAGGEDRKQALQYLKSNYRPGGTIDVATRSNTQIDPLTFPGNRPP